MSMKLSNCVSPQETILYEGKPDRKCFVLESILNPMLPFAVIWFLFDYFFLKFMPSDVYQTGFGILIIPFMLVHMMPVWLYLGGAIFAGLRWGSLNYIVTDHSVYVSRGILHKTVQTKSFAELSHIDLHQGIFDQLLHTADIILTTNQFVHEKADTITLEDISDYQNLFSLLNRLQKDIYADTMYPNDLRPQENHGYHTRYKG